MPNGDFETGLQAPWTNRTYANMALQNVSIVPNPTPGDRHGNYFANFSIAPGGNVWFEQNDVLTATQYQLSLDMQCINTVANPPDYQDLVYVTVYAPSDTYSPLPSSENNFSGGLARRTIIGTRSHTLSTFPHQSHTSCSKSWHRLTQSRPISTLTTSFFS